MNLNLIASKNGIVIVSSYFYKFLKIHNELLSLIIILGCFLLQILYSDIDLQVSSVLVVGMYESLYLII